MASATPDPVTSTKLYCLVTEAHVCEQTAQGQTHDVKVTSPIP